jgi:hypothetical protein
LGAVGVAVKKGRLILRCAQDDKREVWVSVGGAVDGAGALDAGVRQLRYSAEYSGKNQ